jgi:hypothetical protein
MSWESSFIRTVTKEELERLIANSNSVSEVLRKLGYTGGANNHRVFYRRCEEDGIDLAPLKERSKVANAKHLECCRGKVDLEDILSGKVPYLNRTRLKQRMLAEGVLEEKCSECGLGPEWRGKPLSLVLDHINGDTDDQLRENLRLLCPNCNSQTETFAGRNKKLRRQAKESADAR